MEHQLQLEYAALFDVILPFLVRLGLPFPLGGTSNHIRRSALQDRGGWDPWNVTEDVDLGFLLAAAGYRGAKLRLPTTESATPAIHPWLAQRARWLKGHMQTLGVHSRNPLALGWRGALSLSLCLGCGVGAAALHGHTAILLTVTVFREIALKSESGLAVFDLVVLGLGWGNAVLGLAEGARRAGTPMRFRSLGLAAAFWPLQSVALIRALWQLRFCPHHWDKTDHAPDRSSVANDATPHGKRPTLDEAAESGLSGPGEQQPSPPCLRRDDPAHRAVG
jgi:hypothetical protein